MDDGDVEYFEKSKRIHDLMHENIRLQHENHDLTEELRRIKWQLYPVVATWFVICASVIWEWL